MLRFLILTLCFFLPLPALADTWPVSGRDITLVTNALTYAERGRWEQFLAETRAVKDPTARDILLWTYYSSNNPQDFIRVSQFIETHPYWPDREALQRVAEQAIDDSVSSKLLLHWFDRHPPLTAKGMQYYAEAKIAAGFKDPGSVKTINVLLRKAWVDGNFALEDERIFLERHGAILTREDHHNRIDRLLWNARITQASRVMYKADDAHRKLFAARIALQRNMPTVDSAIRQVPASLRQDEGLLFDRISWRERKRLSEGVRQLLPQVPLHSRYPEQWWVIKHRQIRELIGKRQYTNAYRIASTHGLVRGEAFADAEWIAGWLALRFLHKPGEAYTHFERLYRNVQYPVSLGRGAYWAARALEAAGQKENARNWYQTAAKYNKSFYGLLAVERLSPQHPAYFANDPKISPTAQDRQRLQQNPLAKAGYILLKAGYRGPNVKKFISQAVIAAKTPGEKELVGDLALSFRRYELAVAAAKQAAKEGVLLANCGYPVSADVQGDPQRKALYLSIIRQESEFNKDARSPAGAMGYMQLMPATARGMARELNLGFDQRRLADPRYNIQLGSHYIHKLLTLYDNSHVLAIAAYNAGPGNVRKWERGYARYKHQDSLEEAIDWIEMIPFSETRNYVHRVMENMVVYGHSLAPGRYTLSSLLLGIDTQPKTAGSNY